MELMYSLGIERCGEHMWTMSKVKLPNTPGVYFVHDAKKELIYIGQTRNLLRRTVDHFRSDIWFKLFACYISYVNCCSEELRKIEWDRIQEFRPRFNFEHYSTPSDGEMKDAIHNKRII